TLVAPTPGYLAVSGAGDVNGDSIDDIIIGRNGGTPAVGRENAGECYVVFGSPNPFPSVLNVTTLNGINGFLLNGKLRDDYSGTSVSGAGDVNADGIDDILIGAFGADPSGRFGAGESYVVYGRTTTFPTPFELSSLDGANGFVLRGVAANDDSGISV